MFLAPSHSDLGESLLQSISLGYTSESLPVKHRQLARQVGELASDRQKNSMASFEFNVPTISAGTTFVFGSWVCTADGSGGFSSHLIDSTSMKTLRQEQLGETTSDEILLRQLAEEI